MAAQHHSHAPVAFRAHFNTDKPRFIKSRPAKEHRKSRKATPKPRYTPTNVPNDVWLRIVNTLNDALLIRMGQVNHYFYHLCAPRMDKKREELRAFTLDHKSKHHHVCHSCLTYLPEHKFGMAQVREKRSSKGAEAHRRFCADCGVQYGWYCKGSRVQQGNVNKWVCRSCGKLEGGRTCETCAICPKCDPFGHLIKKCEENPDHTVVEQDSLRFTPLFRPYEERRPAWYYDMYADDDDDDNDDDDDDDDDDDSDDYDDDDYDSHYDDQAGEDNDTIEDEVNA